MLCETIVEIACLERSVLARFLKRNLDCHYPCDCLMMVDH